MINAVAASWGASRLRADACDAIGALMLVGRSSVFFLVAMIAISVPAQARQAVGDVAPPNQPVSARDIAFQADRIDYDYEADVVTASGNVVVTRLGNRLRAENVTWDRKSGKVEATGNIAITSPNGDTAYAETIDVTDSLRDGVVEGLLIVSQRGDRVAADKGVRKGGVYVLENAAYTPCRVEDDAGCPKAPTWQITAERVVYDSDARKLRYSGARVSLLGLPVIPLPGLQHPIGDQGGSGLLVPVIGYDRRNGVEMALPYYFRLSGNRDLTVTPHLFSAVAPMLEAQYQALLSRGAYQVTGYVTHGRRSANVATPTSTETETGLRGYVAASGKFQLDPLWSASGSIRYASDRTFLNRYDISREDRLRSTLGLERIGERSYFSFAGWAFQTLRAGDPAGQVPVALPVIDYRLRLADPLLGGRVQFQLNSLAVTRTSGQDTQRAFASAMWSLERLTRLGQQITFTALARGDVYHSDENARTSTVIYRGTPGWQARAIGTVAADFRWPLVGRAFGGRQLITPRLQLVASPKIENLAVPNEDSRAVDLEDSNLFALNRFPGYDRVEDSVRLTYGFDYRLDRPNFAVNATAGQSYRLNNRGTIIPQGTGLSDRLSDIVGRTEVRFRDFVSLTHRYRLDKNKLAVRRNEIDATVGTRRTYAEIGYLRLNRNVTTGVEDLRDIEEVRVAGRIAFAKYWSVFGSTNIDLTGTSDDPTTTLSGFEPVRHRLGIAFEDDCVELGFTWRRDYQTVGDARRGNSFQLRLAFKNLGL